MGSGVKLLGVLLLATLVPACGSPGNTSNSCYITSRFDRTEIAISGSTVDGCGTDVRYEVRVWEFLGLGMAWQVGASAPTGAPVCTIASGGQTWRFFAVGGGGSAAGFCQMLKTSAGLHLWQAGQRQGG